MNSDIYFSIGLFCSLPELYSLAKTDKTAYAALWCNEYLWRQKLELEFPFSDRQNDSRRRYIEFETAELVQISGLDKETRTPIRGLEKIIAGETHTFLQTADGNCFMRKNHKGFSSLCGENHEEFSSCFTLNPKDSRIWLGIDEYAVKNSEVISVISPLCSPDIRSIPHARLFSFDGETCAYYVREDTLYELDLDRDDTLIICEKQGITHLYSGWEFNAFLAEGELFLFGVNDHYQCGVKDVDRVYEPLKLPFEKRITDVSCGGLYTLFITEDGELYCIGGLGLLVQSEIPVRLGEDHIADWNAERVVQVQSNGDDSVFITESNSVYFYRSGVDGDRFRKLRQKAVRATTVSRGCCMITNAFLR